MLDATLGRSPWARGRPIAKAVWRRETETETGTGTETEREELCSHSTVNKCYTKKY